MFFCGGKTSYSNKLRLAATKNLDLKVRECAKILRDTKILAKLADIEVAQDAMYHLPCLTRYYRRAESTKRSTGSKSGEPGDPIETTILSELISYLEEAREEEDITIFKLSDLAKLYQDRLHQFKPDSKVHSTQLKERLLHNLSGLRSETRGQNKFLVFEEDIGYIVFQACSDNDCDAIQLMRVAQIIRKHIFYSTYISLMVNLKETVSRMQCQVNCCN